MSRGRRHTQDQILEVLKEIEAGASIAAAARSHEVSEQTIYRWSQKYAGMTKSELAELKSLQEENRRLRGIVSELRPDNAALRELARGKW